MSDIDLGHIKGNHPVLHHRSVVTGMTWDECSACDAPWPCDAVRLLDCLDQVGARAERAEAALRRIAYNNEAFPAETARAAFIVSVPERDTPASEGGTDG